MSSLTFQKAPAAEPSGLSSVRRKRPNESASSENHTVFSKKTEIEDLATFSHPLPPLHTRYTSHGLNRPLRLLPERAMLRETCIQVRP